MSEFSPKCILVTGGAGFIGSHFVRRVLEKHQVVKVVNLDALTYAANLESLDDVEDRHGRTGDGRYCFVHGDIRDSELVDGILRGEALESVPAGENGARPVPPPDTIVHMAAESHVDRSILGPVDFVETNVKGTVTLLEACRCQGWNDGSKNRFIHVSTDEVYGSLETDEPAFTEDSPLVPNSPYSASKAGSDLLVRAYVQTFGMPAIISRCSNNYGPYQFPEKLIPLMITRALRDEPLPVYGDGGNVRDWLFVADHVDAIWAALTRGNVGAVYNIGGEKEIPNLQVVEMLLSILGKPLSLIRFVADRPGHDRRYAINPKRTREALGWAPKYTFEVGLRETVEWYLANRQWWMRVLAESYRAQSALYA